MGLINFARRAKRASVMLQTAAIQTVQDRWLGYYYPPKPVVIQFPINDICNSRCVMCDIWKRKRDKEITPDELRQILRDPLFTRVRYVGMSGGEPTLRRDLPEIGRALVETLPLLQAFGIITNAVQSQIVIERSLQLAEVARGHKLGFSTMVSLDGVGPDHDSNRGVSGNYESAMLVIERLRKEKLSVGIGCTLTPENCYGADDLLLWCESSGIEFWEFRLGVEIKRVYNEGYAVKHPLTAEQRFHLVTFFDKLGQHPQVDPVHRRFYRSLVGQMAYGLPRSAGCDWRSRGVTLDTRGNISYCSVQSPIFDSALDDSAWQIYRRNLPIRRDIIRTKCDSCQHDLIGLPPLGVAFQEFTQTIAAPLSHRLNRIAAHAFKVRIPTTVNAPMREEPSSWRHVVITGWYGTETAGDKAILGELVSFIKSRSPDCKITLTTLDRKVSEKTNRELTGLSNAALVDLRDAAKTHLIDSCDAVLFGGGPLEEIPALESMLKIFIEANRRHTARIIFGCGVGPLYTKPLRDIVGGILKLATAGFVRDQESWDLAQELGAARSLGCACDPALAFISRWRKEQGTPPTLGAHSTIAALLRANTSEYINDMSEPELNQANRRVAGQLAGILEAGSAERKARVSLLPMHSLWVGGDDRMFNRLIAQAFSNRDAVSVERRYLPVDQLLASIQAADIAVAMRYHGHLFSMALGVPFLSIDYTGQKGKVASLLRRINYSQWSENWRTIDEQRAAAKIGELFRERSYWSEYLVARTAELTGELDQTYKEVFPV